MKRMASPPTSPTHAKRRKSEYHTGSAIPVNLKGMKAQDREKEKDKDAEGDGGEGDEEAVLMEEDDYATQSRYQGQAKQNLRCVLRRG